MLVKLTKCYFKKRKPIRTGMRAVLRALRYKKLISRVSLKLFVPNADGPVAAKQSPVFAAVRMRLEAELLVRRYGYYFYGSALV